MNIFDPEYIAIAVAALYFTFKLIRGEPEEKHKNIIKSRFSYQIDHPRRGNIPRRG